MKFSAALERSATARQRWQRRPGRSRARYGGSCAGSEQARRAEQQHQDEDEEDADLAEAFAEKQAAQALDDADDQPAHQRAGDRAHAAEHDDGEGDQHEGVADARD